MKTTFLLLLFSLLACGSASAQLYPPSPCLDNCGAFTGSCTACHIVNGAEVWGPDFTSYCPDCPIVPAANVMPKVPFQARPVENVLAWLENVATKPDPKLARVMAMTAVRHIALMQRAVHLGLDGPLLGSCRKAFKVGTLDRLPGEIQATRERLIVAQSCRPDDADGECIGGMMKCSDGFWTLCIWGCGAPTRASAPKIARAGK